jgi:hypothetical protein
MKVRTVVSVVCAALTPLLLAVCGSGDSTAPNTAAALVWSTVPSGTTQDLLSVWGNSASDVWAVGSDAGTILHYNGTAWSGVPIPWHYSPRLAGQLRVM